MVAQRDQPAARDLRLLHDHRSRGPVRQLAGIARRKRTPFGQLLPAPEGRRKPREISQSGAGAVALVPTGPDSWQESSPLSRSVTFWITFLGAISASNSPPSCPPPCVAATAARRRRPTAARLHRGWRRNRPSPPAPPRSGSDHLSPGSTWSHGPKRRRSILAVSGTSAARSTLRCVRQGIKGSGCVGVTCSWQSGTMRRKVGKASRRLVEPGFPYLPARRSRLALIPGNWSV